MFLWSSFPVDVVHDTVLVFPNPRIANDSMPLSVCHAIVHGSLVDILFNTVTVCVTEGQVVLCVRITQVSGNLEIVRCSG